MNGEAVIKTVEAAPLNASPLLGRLSLGSPGAFKAAVRGGSAV